MYDYMLGGKDNFKVDRDAVEQLISILPEAPQMARSNRKFTIRAGRHCARQGYTQVVDIGTGIPSQPNVFEAIAEIDPEVRVVGVDNDPVVLVHNRAFLPGRLILGDDVRFPERVITHLAEHIDLARPTAVLMVALLHFIRDPEPIIASFADGLAPGSCFVFSHVSATGTEQEVIDRVERVYASANAPLFFRTETQIRGLFAGTSMHEPGVVPVQDWRPDEKEDHPRVQILGGMTEIIK